ncbi:MAG: KOW domain-containing RNA-binding protein [Eubacteriales bacterium]|nr:KOW domain-containing RNA-binding protein [Eubacteriales bacterium]
MQVKPIGVGSVVRSRAGRDAGDLFLVVGILDQEYVLLANGELRKAEKPKKKKLKHLSATGRKIEQAEEAARQGSLTNAQIRSWLSNEEEL